MNATLILAGTNTGPVRPRDRTARDHPRLRHLPVRGHDTVVTGGIFYDQHSLLAQIGHA